MRLTNIKERLKIRLLLGQKITALQAFNLWNTIRLAVYIDRLRKDKYNIVTEMVHSKTTNKTFARYYIPKKN